MAINLDVHGNTKPLEAAVQSAINRIRRQPIKISVDDKGATQPLGNMKRAADEFSKSMEAANARIIAFGASMAIINGMADAFKGMVRNMVEVEKSLADINVVMGLSTQKLDEFSDGLFKVAKETGAAFKVAADAATEYARQGLSVEESLKRTKDALILTRLTGMDSAAAVKSLTAAMNTYGNQIKDTTELVSKFAAVDVKFAVSAEDFADAIARTGAAAKGAGVDIDELIGLVTAAQQQTARGGKVIGNSFKTIFTRIGRTDTLNQLENLGIAVRDIEGKTLGAKRILTDLANTFDSLSESQKAQIAQTVGGVFQINVLKAVLGDAAKQNGILANATQISAGATTEAIDKNEQLRQTMAAMATETGLAIKQVSSQIGEIMLAPGIEKVLNIVKSGAEGLSGILGDGEGSGSKFANGFLKGLGNVISGPGLVIITAVFGKLFLKAASFAKESLTSLIGVTTEAQKQKAIQTSLVGLFGRSSELSKEMLRTDISRTEKEKIILGLLKAQVAEAKMLDSVAKSSAATLYSKGFGANLTPRRGRAYGHIPNFANPERKQAARGGYAAGSIRSMDMPGEGSIIYNSAEKVKTFSGLSQPAIMPPLSSKAGKNYQQAFGAVHGFDPYAAKGFIPNFNSINISAEAMEAKYKDLDSGNKNSVNVDGFRAVGAGKTIGGKTGKESFEKREGFQNPVIDLNDVYPQVSQLGVVLGVGTETKEPQPIEYSTPMAQVKRLDARKKLAQKINVDLEDLDGKTLLSTLPTKAISPVSKKDLELIEKGKSDAVARRTIGDLVKDELTDFAKKIHKNIFGGLAKGQKPDFTSQNIIKHIDPGTLGNLYETSLRTALGDRVEDNKQASFDFRGADAKELSKFFGKSKTALELKYTLAAAKSGGIPKKILNYVSGYADGYIPNFAKVKWSTDKKKGQHGLTGSHMELMHFVDYLEKVGVDPKKLDVLKTRIKKIQSNVGKKRTEFKQNNVPGFGRSGARFYDQLGAISEGSYLDTKGTFIKDLGKHVKDFNRGGGMFVGGLNAGKGFIPNFAADPLADAIGRERDAGVPVSQIRVGTHPALMNKGNPIGLGVTNTKDEPNGLKDVFGAKGYVPNYAINPMDYIRSVGNKFSSGRDEYKAAHELQADLNKENKKLLKQKTSLTAQLAKGKNVQAELTRVDKQLQLNKKEYASALKMASDSTKKTGGLGRVGGIYEKISGHGASKFLGRQMSGFGGMGLMMGAPMLAGMLQSGESGETELQRVNRMQGSGYKTGGALMGMGTGAAMGMMLGPIGMAVGAAVGAFMGWTSAVEEGEQALKEFNRATAERKAGNFGIAAQALLPDSVDKSIFNALDNAVESELGRNVFKPTEKGFNPSEASVEAISGKLFGLMSQGDQKEQISLGDAGKSLGLTGGVGTREQVVNRLKKEYEIAQSTKGGSVQRKAFNKKLFEIAENILGSEKLRLQATDKERQAVIRRLSVQEASLKIQERFNARMLEIQDSLEKDNINFDWVEKFGARGNEIVKAQIDFEKKFAALESNFEKGRLGAANKALLTGLKAVETGKLDSDLKNAVQEIDFDKLGIELNEGAQAAISGIFADLDTGVKDIDFSDFFGNLDYEQFKKIIDFLSEKNKSPKIKELAENLERTYDFEIQANKDIFDQKSGILKLEDQLTKALASRSEHYKTINREIQAQNSFIENQNELDSLNQRYNELKLQGATKFLTKQQVISQEIKNQSEELKRQLSTTTQEKVKSLADQLINVYKESQAEVPKELMAARAKLDFQGLKSAMQSTNINDLTDPENIKSRIDSKIAGTISPFNSLEEQNNIKALTKIRDNLNDEQLKKLKDQFETISNNTHQYEEQIEKLRQINNLIEENSKQRLPGTFADGFDSAAKEMRSEVDYFEETMGSTVAYKLRDGLVSAMDAAINRSQDLGDALRGIALGFLQAIQQAMMTSMANQIVGSMGFATASNGGMMRKYSKGGGVPAMVTNGEYVMSKTAVNKYGANFMHSLNARGKLPGFNTGGEAGSAINYGSGVPDTGRKYQRKHMSGFFYSGQAGNLALDEDANMMKGVVGERLARQRQEAAKRRAKKAQRRALLTSLISTVAMAGIAHGINSMGNSTPVGKGTVLSPTADGGYPGVAGYGTVLSAPSDGFQYDFSSGLNAFGSRSYGGKINKYASGGYISGKSGIDQIPAMLSEGEYVIKASSARQLGKPMLDRINAGKFYEGGETSPLKEKTETSSSGGNTNNINISVNVKNGSSNQEASKDNQKTSTEEQEKNAKLAEKMKQQVVAVILEEQRPGGLLSS